MTTPSSMTKDQETSLRSSQLKPPHHTLQLDLLQALTTSSKFSPGMQSDKAPIQLLLSRYLQLKIPTNQMHQQQQLMATMLSLNGKLPALEDPTSLATQYQSYLVMLPLCSRLISWTVTEPMLQSSQHKTAQYLSLPSDLNHLILHGAQVFRLM